MSSTWRDHDLWFWQTVKLEDGAQQRGGHVMRRRSPHSHWQYRSPTDAEDKLWQDVQQR